MTRGPRRGGRNIAASVRDRLTRRARANAENVQLLLTRYAIERLLYRLGISPHRERFVLKGAMLFSLWAPSPYRPTGDLDLLGYGTPTTDAMIATFREVCAIETPDDGVTFLLDTVRAEVARAEDEYSGLRVTVRAAIGSVRLPIRIDIGFGDVVTPAVQEVAYPSLLDMPMPRLRAYPPETVVAEKVHALVALGMLNSRMKDFFDLWAISQTLSFEGAMLSEALRATFARRATPLTTQAPIALTDAFAQDTAKQAQWRGFLRRTAVAVAPQALPDLLRAVAAFVTPPLAALAAEAPFTRAWQPGGPWR